jgi:hypothetical protein
VVCVLVGLLLRCTVAVPGLTIGPSIVHAILIADLLRWIATAVVTPTIGAGAVSVATVPVLVTPPIAITRIVSGLICRSIIGVVVSTAIMTIPVVSSIVLALLQTLSVRLAVLSCITVITMRITIVGLLPVVIAILSRGLHYTRSTAAKRQRKRPWQVLPKSLHSVLPFRKLRLIDSLPVQNAAEGQLLPYAL